MAGKRWTDTRVARENACRTICEKGKLQRRVNLHLPMLGREKKKDTLRKTPKKKRKEDIGGKGQNIEKFEKKEDNLTEGSTSLLEGTECRRGERYAIAGGHQRRGSA